MKTSGLNIGKYNKSIEKHNAAYKWASGRHSNQGSERRQAHTAPLVLVPGREARAASLSAKAATVGALAASLRVTGPVRRGPFAQALPSSWSLGPRTTGDVLFELTENPYLHKRSYIGRFGLCVCHKVLVTSHKPYDRGAVIAALPAGQRRRSEIWISQGRLGA